MNDQPLTAQAIRRYYEQNTRLFLSFGSSPRTQTIHRAVWAEAVHTHDQALNYSNALILAEIEQLIRAQALSQARVIDLGCGVGGTLFYLLPRLTRPVQAIGLTISPLQARLAHRHAQHLGLPHPYIFLEGDFMAVPVAAAIDVAYSVEAFVHAPDPRRYFEEVARLLRPGGRLLLCDDFLSQRVTEPDPPQAWLEAYQRGWHVPNLDTVEHVDRLARAHGLRLIQQRELTPHLRLRALPNWLATLIINLGRRLPIQHAILPSTLGSIALQQCLKLGLIQYHFLVFEKQAVKLVAGLINP